MTRDDGESRREAAMRDRDTGERRRSDRRRHAGHDLVRDARSLESQRLFAAAAEHEWIAALEADDALSALRGADHQTMDSVLIDRVSLGALADVEPLRDRREVEHIEDVSK